MYARPATAKEIARRALGLSALVCRNVLEDGAGDEYAADKHAMILRWADRSGIVSALEANEIKILASPLGILGREDRALAFWRHEQLTVLTFALGKIPAPNAAERYNEGWVARKVGFLRQDADDIIACATARSPADLAVYAVYVDDTREMLLEMQKKSPEADDIKACLAAAHERGGAVEWLLGQRALELEAPLLT